MKQCIVSEGGDSKAELEQDRADRHLKQCSDYEGKHGKSEPEGSGAVDSKLKQCSASEEKDSKSELEQRREVDSKLKQ